MAQSPEGGDGAAVASPKEHVGGQQLQAQIAQSFAVGNELKLTVLGRGGQAMAFHVTITDELRKTGNNGKPLRMPEGVTDAVLRLVFLETGAESNTEVSGAPDGRSVVERVNEEISLMASNVMHMLFPRMYGWRFGRLLDRNTDDAAFIFMEYCDGGDLAAEIKRRRDQNKPFTEMDIKLVLVQLLCAVNHLHLQQVTHRDIKPGNILLKRNGMVKLTDFGLSTMRHRLTTFTGTMLYMAPEQVAGHGRKEYTNSVDVWAVGLVLWELLFLKRAYEPRNTDHASMKRAHNKPRATVSAMLDDHPHAREYPQELMQMVDVMLSVDVESRPPVERLIETTFMQRCILEVWDMFNWNLGGADAPLRWTRDDLELFRDSLEDDGIQLPSVDDTQARIRAASTSSGNDAPMSSSPRGSFPEARGSCAEEVPPMALTAFGRDSDDRGESESPAPPDVSDANARMSRVLELAMREGTINYETPRQVEQHEELWRDMFEFDCGVFYDQLNREWPRPAQSPRGSLRDERSPHLSPGQQTQPGPTDPPPDPALATNPAARGGSFEFTGETEGADDWSTASDDAPCNVDRPSAPPAGPPSTQLTADQKLELRIRTVVADEEVERAALAAEVTFELADILADELCGDLEAAHRVTISRAELAGRGDLLILDTARRLEHSLELDSPWAGDAGVSPLISDLPQRYVAAHVIPAQLVILQAVEATARAELHDEVRAAERHLRRAHDDVALQAEFDQARVDDDLCQAVLAAELQRSIPPPRPPPRSPTADGGAQHRRQYIYAPPPLRLDSDSGTPPRHSSGGRSPRATPSRAERDAAGVVQQLREARLAQVYGPPPTSAASSSRPGSAARGRGRPASATTPNASRGQGGSSARPMDAVFTALRQRILETSPRGDPAPRPATSPQRHSRPATAGGGGTCIITYADERPPAAVAPPPRGDADGAQRPPRRPMSARVARGPYARDLSAGAPMHPAAPTAKPPKQRVGRTNARSWAAREQEDTTTYRRELARVQALAATAPSESTANAVTRVLASLRPIAAYDPAVLSAELTRRAKTQAAQQRLAKRREQHPSDASMSVSGTD